jgi:hypothetical protein
MKRMATLTFLLAAFVCAFAQSSAKTDSHSAGQTTVIRIDGATQNVWVRDNNDSPTPANAIVSANENVSFYSTSEGIYLTILSGTNKIKLFALTGQLLFNGDLTQGKFLIQNRKGIYFLKVNNKSFKVICK